MTSHMHSLANTGVDTNVISRLAEKQVTIYMHVYIYIYIYTPEVKSVQYIID